MAAALPEAPRSFAEPITALLAHHILMGPPELPSGQIPHKHSQTEYKVSLTGCGIIWGRV